MKKLGMIGGVSWQSTIEYYRIINEAINKKLGGHHSANVVMSCIDFEPLVKYAHEDKWDEIAELLKIEVQRLETAGADYFIICSNAIHKIAEDLAAAVQIPLLHIVDVIADEIKRKDLGKVGLLGANFTMEDELFPKRLAQQNIDTIIPIKADREKVHQVIFNELIQGEINDVSRHEYQRIIDSLIEEGAQGVILGCTEIPLLIKQEQISVPIFDSTYIHARAAAEKMI